MQNLILTCTLVGGEEYEDEVWEEYLENYVDCNWHIASYEEYVEWCENWDYEPKAKEDI